MMRAEILALALAAAALPALAQTALAQTGAAPSREAVALGGRVARAAQPRLDQGLQTLVDGLADNYRNQASRLGQPVDEKALAEVVKSEAVGERSVLWDGMARIYAGTYTTEELKALIEFYRLNPGAPPQGLPTSLGAKNEDIERGQRELVAQFGPRVVQNFFGDYCSRAPCSDDVRRTAGLPVRGNN